MIRKVKLVSEKNLKRKYLLLGWVNLERQCLQFLQVRVGKLLALT